MPIEHLTPKDRQRLDREVSRSQRLGQRNKRLYEWLSGSPIGGFMIFVIPLFLLIVWGYEWRDRHIRDEMHAIVARNAESFLLLQEKMTTWPCENQLAVCWKGLQSQTEESLPALTESFLEMNGRGKIASEVLLLLLVALVSWFIWYMGWYRRASLLMWEELRKRHSIH